MYEVKVFEDKTIRCVRSEKGKQWFFVIKDIVQILTETKDVKDYLKKLRKRNFALKQGWGQIVTPVSIKTRGGVQPVNCADSDGILRIIEVIKSPKKEPLQRWLSDFEGGQ